MAKRKRKARTSSGARKAWAGKNVARKGPAVADAQADCFLRQQDNDRWPTETSKNKAWDMAKDKKPRSNRKSKPRQIGFCMLDLLIDKPNLEKLLVAASLKVKKVRRYPGWVLERTYNLKDRPIEII